MTFEINFLLNSHSDMNTTTQKVKDFLSNIIKKFKPEFETEFGEVETDETSDVDFDYLQKNKKLRHFSNKRSFLLKHILIN